MSVLLWINSGLYIPDFFLVGGRDSNFWLLSNSGSAVAFYSVTLTKTSMEAW